MEPIASHRSVASWLGVLLFLVVALNTMGGWVRLSGSGVAIPHWPVIDGSVLPPITEARWQRVYEIYRQDQTRLGGEVAAGRLTEHNRGRQPADLAEFRGMFMIEWSHRLLAALVGVVGLGCLITVLRRAPSRSRIGALMVAAAAISVFQAVLGGLLVRVGTGHHWLFLHQANAALVVGLILWSILRLLDQGESARRPGRLLGVSVVAVFLQITMGGLLAGSREGADMPVSWPGLIDTGWDTGQPLVANLLNNAMLHRWLHHLGAGVVTVLIIAALADWRRAGPRQRLGLQLAVTFLAVQMLFGLGNVALGVDARLALAHLVIGHSLFLSLLLAWYDARNEAVAGVSTVQVRSLA